MTLRQSSFVAGVVCVLLLGGAIGSLGGEESFPGSIGFSVTSHQSEAGFLFQLESVMLANGFQLDSRSLPAEHTYTYSFRWINPDTENDFWKVVNKWQGDGELTARLVPGGSDTEMTWRITFTATSYAYSVTRADMEKAILELLQAKLQIALSTQGGK